jgi:hypothetical protein
MTGSSPDDLAIAFRSFDRRRREAQGDLGNEAITDLAEHLRTHLDRAAAVLRCPSDAAAIADAIDRRHADEWTDDALEVVRTAALDAGATIRQIAQRADDAR